MGGKTTKSTQQITIPPEVLARYNAINARADTVTNKPYQYYQGQFVAPLTATQQAGIANTNAAAGMAQPYFGAATNQLMGAQQAATPYYQNATNQLNQGVSTGNQFANQSANTLTGAQGVGSQLAGQSLNTINAAQDQGAGIQQGALSNLGAAYASAQPYNEAAGGLYQQGLAQGSDITGRSLAGTQQALTGAQPYQGMATDYMTSGAQAVNPYDLGADQINKYMSPYLNTVLQGTAGLLNQQNQQQQAGQMGNAIRSGAFGGDRSGIAAANLNQQQNLANAQIFSGILNQGFGQALGTAQQQQQLGLGAAQANRAAQQQASQQALAIGQQGFGQGLAAAQQQGALGQQLFNMNAATGQNAAALGQQVYGQGTNTAQQQSNVGNTLFNQGATAAAQQAALGQQQFGQGATAAAQQAALGQQQFGQGLAASQQGAALGQGLYGMGANTSSQLAALGTGAQGAALSGAGAQLAAGQVDQATQQAENVAKYNEFLQAQSLPYQQLKLASDIALGTGTAQGSTTTTAQPGGFFSDERLKENIKPVGKTFDGQTIHSYNYKGDPRTQIGLIAQEVQKHHPEAVGVAGGYKTVDYDKATEDASDRGHMAYGGLASAGGSVMPQDAGQGFSNGGVAGFDPSTMQQILAAQQAMYAPLSSNNMYSGGPNAGGGLVPQSSVAASQLMTPAELPRQPTGAEQAKTMVELGNSVNEFGEGVGAWGDEDKKPEDGKGKDPKLALGGGVPYSGQGLDIPQEDTASKSYQLPTAGSMEKPESGLDKVGKIAKIAGTVASIFSDKRMKENIKPIGKLFDGQIVHSYNYKGDPRTQIGLIAQEVEGHKPHAVGNIRGMKAVDYAKATSSAAKRGHFAMGGQPAAGLMGAEMNGLDDADRESDFNLGPEDILSGGDPDTEFFMRDSFKKPESPAQAAGLGALEDKSAQIRDAYKPKNPFKPRPTGLAPKADALPTGIAQIARLIHAGEGTGKNPKSSALGPYQFVDSTFVGEFRKNYPDRAQGMSDRQIIALKRSPEGVAISSQMGPKFIANNAKIVERAGFVPDAGNVYLAHFLGPDTAVKVLRANPNAPISRYVSQEAINANPPLQKNPTVGGTINWARGYMGQQAQRLSRPARAEGGLAGRGGYQDGGAPKTEEELAAELIAETPTKAIIPAPSMRKEGGLGAAVADTTPTATAPQAAVQTGVAAPVKEDIVVDGSNLLKPNATPRQTIYGRGRQEPVSYEGGKIPNFGYDYLTDPFLKGIKRGSASSIIPLLTGIAAMGTAPTRSLGVALATGLGAGAQSYQNLGNERNKQLVQRQIGAARYADSVRAYFDKEFMPIGNGKYFYRGREIGQDEYDKMYYDAMNNASGSLIPSLPETAKMYKAPAAPEAPKPVAITDKPDMNTVSGVYANAYNDPIVQDLRGRQAGARESITKDRLLQNDPQIQLNPNAFAATNSRIAAAQTALTDATAGITARLSELTNVSLANLSATQIASFEQTLQKASALEEQKSAFRPVMQQFNALGDNLSGGTAQDAWAKIVDFLKSAGNLTEEQAGLLGSGADANSKQAIMQIIGGPVFDPNKPGAALRWARDNYFKPRYLDLETQIKSIQPFTQTTSAPQSSVGVSPPIVSPPAPTPNVRTQWDKDAGVWRGQSLSDIQNDPSVPKGAAIRYRDASGKIVQGVK